MTSVDIFRLHSLSNELRRHQSWFLTVRTLVHLDRANQGLEVLHILCVGHVVGLVIRRNLMLCLLEGTGTLLMVDEVAAVPSDDQEELHDVLISLGLHEHGGSLKLAVKIGRALSDDKREHLLLVLLELNDLLLYRGNVLLPDVYISGIDIGLPSLCLWVPSYLQSRKAQHLDCLCGVGPTFILSLYVVGHRIDRLLVFSLVFHVSDVEGEALES